MTMAWGYADKPQSWFDSLAKIQNELTVLSAEVEEVGDSVWNLVSEQASGMSQFQPFQAVKDLLVDTFRSLVVTKTTGPTDEQVNRAAGIANSVRAMVDFAKSVAPEVAAAVDAKGAAVEAAVSAAPLQSPNDVGWDEFEKQMKDRAKKLIPDFSLGLVAAVGAGLRLPPRNRRGQFRSRGSRGRGRRGGRRSGGLFSGTMGKILPIAIAGVAIWYFMGKKSASAEVPLIPNVKPIDIYAD
jgi:hypothetical protein